MWPFSSKKVLEKKKEEVRYKLLRTFIVPITWTHKGVDNIINGFVKILVDDVGFERSIAVEVEDDRFRNSIKGTITYRQCELWMQRQLTLVELDEMLKDYDIRYYKVSGKDDSEKS